MKPRRRNFLKAGSLAVVSLSTLLRTAGAAAQAKKDAKKGAPRLPESDPQAMALGYKEDAKKVDKAKFANYKPGQECDDCVQFEGKEGDAWAPCKIFQGKAVAGKGWCAAYQPKKT